MDFRAGAARRGFVHHEVFLLLKSGRCNSPNDGADLRKLRGADLDKDSLIFHGQKLGMQPGKT